MRFAVICVVLVAAQGCGTGDRSSFSPLLESLVLKGDVLLEFRLDVAGQARQKWEALARKALVRL